MAFEQIIAQYPFGITPIMLFMIGIHYKGL